MTLAAIADDDIVVGAPPVNTEAIFDMVNPNVAQCHTRNACCGLSLMNRTTVMTFSAATSCRLTKPSIGSYHGAEFDEEWVANSEDG